ncbi:MAG: LPS assembly protein LptD [Phycisphaerales bacterium]|nr:LPS assembly protein LptD [Phycisphaerales bacterium]
MGVMQRSNLVRRVMIALAAASSGLALPAIAAAGGVRPLSLRESQPIGPGLASRALALQGVGLAPVEGDATLSCLRATIWREGEVQRIYLDGWVNVSVGPYDFTAERGVVWINRQEYADGTNVSEIALYLENVSAVARPSGMSSEGDQLLITAAITGKVTLQSDEFNEDIDTVPPEILERGEARVLAQLASQEQTPPPGPQVKRIAPPEPPALIEQPKAVEPGGPPLDFFRPQVGIPPEATIAFRMDGRLEYHVSEDGSEGTITLRDNLVVQYLELSVRPPEREPRQLTLTADRAVIFTDPIAPEDLQTQQIDASAVRGIYLEGNVVATDGKYTMRGPRIYYEFSTNRAIVLDGVVHTYSQEARVPIYMRADEIRQSAHNEWQADHVRISTSEFYTPHVSIGAGHVTLEKRENPATRETENYIKVRNATLRAGDLPVFWLPGYKGRAEGTPLRRFTVGASGQNGATVKTEWDLLGIMGWETPFSNADASLLVDYYAERGPAVGLDAVYGTRDSHGRFFGYLIQDDGEDRLSSGAERDVEDETRGIATWSHFARLPDDWTFISEFSYISDPTFVDSFFDNEAEERREYRTRLFARQQRDNWAFEAFVNYDLNNLIANEDLLQSQGYLVEKVPELGYYRFADSLFDGRLVWTSEYQLSRMRLSFPDHTLREIGQGQAGFGMPPSTNLSAAALMAGYREDYVNRFTTGQEISYPFEVGIFRVVPFGVGRFTFYDDDFSEFSQRAEAQRYFGGGGVRVATQFSRINNTVESRLFDLHRIRHIIEPSLTFFSADSDAGVGDSPIYDVDVEGITTGTVMRVGMRNTWQTQRGGPGRWRSVDVFILDTDFVLSTSETQGDYSLPRYFDYRPELSHLGDHFAGDFMWLVSDQFALAGNMIYDLDRDSIARSAVGYRLDHSRDLYSYTDLRYAEVDDSNLLTTGLGYSLTSLYQFRGSVTFDLNRDDAQSTNLELIRKTPQMDIIFGFSYDQIREDTTISLSLSPRGSGGHRIGGALNPRDEIR